MNFSFNSSCFRFSSCKPADDVLTGTPDYSSVDLDRSQSQAASDVSPDHLVTPALVSSRLGINETPALVPGEDGTQIGN